MSFEFGSWRALHEVVDQVVAAAASERIAPSPASSGPADDGGGDEFRGALRLTEMASMLSAKTIVIEGTTCTGRA